MSYNSNYFFLSQHFCKHPYILPVSLASAFQSALQAPSSPSGPLSTGPTGHSVRPLPRWSPGPWLCISAVHPGPPNLALQPFSPFQAAHSDPTLLSSSLWMARRHFKFSIFKKEFLVPWPLLSTFLDLLHPSLLYLDKWHYYSSACHKPESLSFLFLLTPPYPVSHQILSDSPTSSYSRNCDLFHHLHLRCHLTTLLACLWCPGDHSYP